MYAQSAISNEQIDVVRRRQTSVNSPNLSGTELIYNVFTFETVCHVGG